jgi:predicted transcriptional regulator
MNIQLEKLELMKQLLETENPSIIEAIKAIFKKEKKDFWDELTQEQKEEIELGIAEADAGNVVDFNEFIAKYIK